MEHPQPSSGNSHDVMLAPATIDDLPLLQRMIQFYIYDLAKECRYRSDSWALPADGVFEGFDANLYLEDPSRRAYLIKADDEVAGFILLNQVTAYPTTTWNMGEFFVFGGWQRQGVGKKALEALWCLHPGRWEVAILPENTPALLFWEKTIPQATNGTFVKEGKSLVSASGEHKPMVVFAFDVDGTFKATS